MTQDNTYIEKSTINGINQYFLMNFKQNKIINIFKFYYWKFLWALLRDAKAPLTKELQRQGWKLVTSHATSRATSRAEEWS